MMKLGINGGSMEITDDNKTIVSGNIAQEIKDGSEEKPDGKKDWTTPELVIKD
jgi:hypothetical protein